jgi:hypothetical protein
MTTPIEVWDDHTGNQIASFGTVSEAEAFLWGMLEMNGPDAVRELFVLTYEPNAAGEPEPLVVLEGCDFVARHVAHA